MAINGCELRVIEYLVANLTAKLARRPRTLLLGYPDILAIEQTFANLNLSLDWSALPKRESSRQIWLNHGRDFGDAPMCESKALMHALGSECVVLDAIPWGGEDFVVDLNLPLSASQRAALGTFDLIIDPGTVEHCFNIAQAFLNIEQLLTPCGFIYHQAAVAFPNHGFWSISPTAFFDFYESRNFTLGEPYVWRGTCDQEGFEPKFNAIDPFAAILGVATPLIGSFMFQAPDAEHAVDQDTPFPIQRCYSSKPRRLTLHDYCAAALPETHRVTQKLNLK